MMRERRTNFARRERFERLRQSLLVRLSKVCAAMPHHELWDLSSQMVRVQMKYEFAPRTDEDQRIRVAGYSPIRRSGGLAGT